MGDEVDTAGQSRLQAFKQSDTSKTWVDPRSGITTALGGGMTAVASAVILNMVFGWSKISVAFVACLLFSFIQVSLSPDPEFPSAFKRTVARVSMLLAAAIGQFVSALGINEGLFRLTDTQTKSALIEEADIGNAFAALSAIPLLPEPAASTVEIPAGVPAAPVSSIPPAHATPPPTGGEPVIGSGWLLETNALRAVENVVAAPEPVQILPAVSRPKRSAFARF